MKLNYKIVGVVTLIILITTGFGCKNKTIIETPVVKQNLTLFSVKSGDYKLLNNAGSLTWTGRSITETHNGTLDISSGYLTVKNGNIENGRFEINMMSITVKDIQNKKSNLALTKLLKSESFFNVKEFPTSILEIKKVQPILTTGNGANALITADLTINGITNQIIFPATITTTDLGKIIAKAQIEINRTRWDLTYRSGTFFDNLEDKVISDAISFTMNLEFKKK